MWEADTGLEVLTLKEFPPLGEVHSVAFSADGKRIASAGKSVMVWDAGEGQVVRTLKANRSTYAPTVRATVNGIRLVLTLSGVSPAAETGSERSLMP
jgi:WD40 repeat protein